jgi:predicted DNA-binding protein (UPF0278 family)
MPKGKMGLDEEAILKAAREAEKVVRLPKGMHIDELKERYDKYVKDGSTDSVKMDDIFVCMIAREFIIREAKKGKSRKVKKPTKAESKRA